MADLSLMTVFSGVKTQPSSTLQTVTGTREGWDAFSNLLFLSMREELGLELLQCYGVDRCLQQANDMALLCLLDSALSCLLTKLLWDVCRQC